MYLSQNLHCTSHAKRSSSLSLYAYFHCIILNIISEFSFGSMSLFNAWETDRQTACLYLMLERQDRQTDRQTNRPPLSHSCLLHPLAIVYMWTFTCLFGFPLIMTGMDRPCVSGPHQSLPNDACIYLLLHHNSTGLRFWPAASGRPAINMTDCTHASQNADIVTTKLAKCHDTNYKLN